MQVLICTSHQHGNYFRVSVIEGKCNCLCDQRVTPTLMRVPEPLLPDFAGCSAENVPAPLVACTVVVVVVGTVVVSPGIGTLVVGTGASCVVVTLTVVVVG